jgi:hypothetical protein
VHASANWGQQRRANWWGRRRSIHFAVAVIAAPALRPPAGHSRKHNIFTYGCEASAKAVAPRIFPRLLADCPHFSLPDCSYKVACTRIEWGSRAVGRAHTWRLGGMEARPSRSVGLGPTRSSLTPTLLHHFTLFFNPHRTAGRGVASPLTPLLAHSSSFQPSRCSALRRTPAASSSGASSAWHTHTRSRPPSAEPTSAPAPLCTFPPENFRPWAPHSSPHFWHSSTRYAPACSSLLPRV